MAAPVITKLAEPLNEGPTPEILDEIALTSEERASAHFSALTRDGRQVRVSLPRGSELQDGDVLVRDRNAAVVVRAAKEELLWLTPKGDTVAWSAACYQLGNLHRPARFLDDGVLTPQDMMVLQMMRSLDVSVEQVYRPFIGRRFGAAGAHHHHDHPQEDHDHGHQNEGHHHDHDHDLHHRGPIATERR
jgi:urease accessory protein